MARNGVQFQKGLSEAEFDGLYGTEEQCRAVVIKLRWPNGFSCPVCGGTSHSIHTSRGLFQCTRCRRQTSPTAGTIFAATKLPLRTWFDAEQTGDLLDRARPTPRCPPDDGVDAQAQAAAGDDGA